jgi:SAM-dependent methyltransferase
VLAAVPPERIFIDDYPYFSSVSDTLRQHSQANVSERIREEKLDAKSFVVEIASNDGYLLRAYRDAGIPHLRIDPAKGPVEAARAEGIETMHAFFGEALARELASDGVAADLIHANNVLAHVPDLGGFVDGMRILLKPTGTAVIEVPYLRDLIDHGEFDTIYHEHLCYFSVTALARLFRRHGLHLNRVERISIHGGSLRLFVGRKDLSDGSVERMRREEAMAGVTLAEYYRGFARQVVGIREGLLSLLRVRKREGRRMAGYGAAAKGTILLNYCGVSAGEIAWVADRNVVKQGRWIPGIAIPIVAPAAIQSDPPDDLLVLPWNFSREIMHQERDFAIRGGRFIIPIPRPTVIRDEEVALEALF